MIRGYRKEDILFIYSSVNISGSAGRMSRYDEALGHSRALIRGLFLFSQCPCVNSTTEALDVMTDYIT
jgi:hypothetical protein